MRISDGIHFTVDGADYLAKLSRLLDQRWDIGKQADRPSRSNTSRQGSNDTYQASAATARASSDPGRAVTRRAHRRPRRTVGTTVTTTDWCADLEASHDQTSPSPPTVRHRPSSTTAHDADNS